MRVHVCVCVCVHVCVSACVCVSECVIVQSFYCLTLNKLQHKHFQLSLVHKNVLYNILKVLRNPWGESIENSIISIVHDWAL